MPAPGILIYTYKHIPENGVMNGSDASGGVKGQCGLPGNLHLGPADVLLLEQELTVQVAHFDGVQINLNQNVPHPTLKFC